MEEGSPMLTICAWCKKPLEGQQDFPEQQISHGICPDCYRIQMAKLPTRKLAAVVLSAFLSACTMGEHITKVESFADGHVETTLCTQKYAVIPYYAVVVAGVFMPTWEGPCRTETLNRSINVTEVKP